MFTRPGTFVYTSPQFFFGSGSQPGTVGLDTGLVALDAGVTFYAIEFASALTGITGIDANLLPPNSSSPAIVARVDYSTLTPTGVTVRFTAVPANYRLSWIVIGS